MHVNELIKLVLIGLCIFSVIFFIFGLAKIDWDTNVDEVLKIYRNELERTKKELEIGNNKIDKIEKEIFTCKKKLNKRY